MRPTPTSASRSIDPLATVASRKPKLKEKPRPDASMSAPAVRSKLSRVKAPGSPNLMPIRKVESKDATRSIGAST